MLRRNSAGTLAGSVTDSTKSVERFHPKTGLLSNGADVNLKDEIGETALGCASRCGHTEIAQLLQQAGAKY